MDLSVLRDDMVQGLEHESKGVLESSSISVAMRTVPRHEFVGDASAEAAYQDCAFTYRGTTILSPSMVARLLEALNPTGAKSVLVVGAGTGYTVAVLAEIVGAAKVSAIDLSRGLVWDARHNLSRTGYERVFVDCRDGAEGLPEYAPFDRILVEAAAIDPPAPLLDQLTTDGRLVMPRGVTDQQLIVHGKERLVDTVGPVRFKPLLIDGEQAGGIERNRTTREDQEFAARAAERRRGWEHEWIDWDHTEF